MWVSWWLLATPMISMASSLAWFASNCPSGPPPLSVQALRTYMNQIYQHRWKKICGQFCYTKTKHGSKHTWMGVLVCTDRSHERPAQSGQLGNGYGLVYSITTDILKRVWYRLEISTPCSTRCSYSFNTLQHALQLFLPHLAERAAVIP